MAQEEGAERGWPWADDARACVRLWRPCDLGRRRQEPPRALWLPPTGMGSRGRMTAQTGRHGGEVTEWPQTPSPTPRGLPAGHPEPGRGSTRVHLRQVRDALDWDAQDTLEMRILLAPEVCLGGDG